MKTKIKTRPELKEIVSKLRKEKPSITIVTTNGTFDIIHSGHVHSLRKAKEQGDILIVGLNTDASVKRYKSPLRPIIPEKERAEMLANLEMVNYVSLFDEDDPREFLKVIKPDVHVKSKSGYTGIEKDVVESNGGKVVLLDDIQGISTTNIINKILEIYKAEGAI